MQAQHDAGVLPWLVLEQGEQGEQEEQGELCSSAGRAANDQYQDDSDTGYITNGQIQTTF